MSGEIAVGIVTLASAPVGWLIYEVITHKEAIANIKETLAKMDSKLDKLLER